MLVPYAYEPYFVHLWTHRRSLIIIGLGLIMFVKPDVWIFWSGYISQSWFSGISFKHVEHIPVMSDPIEQGSVPCIGHL